MILNQNDLTKNFPQLTNEKYKTPAWVGWFNLLYMIGSLPMSGYLTYVLLNALKTYAPIEWQSTLIDQEGVIGGLLWFPILLVLLFLFQYINNKYFIKDLFTGATGYILADEEEMNLRKIFDIQAKRVPPNTQIFIFLLNRQQDAKLSKRRNDRGDIRSTIEEAKAHGINLDTEKYPVLSINKSEEHQDGNVNLLQTIKVPPLEGKTKIESYLPERIDFNNAKITLQKPSLTNGLLTEIVIRVTVYSENECVTHFEALINPMETAFCVEI